MPKRERDAAERMTLDDILSVLPQRYPFLFIDKVLEVRPAEGRIVCRKCTSLNEPFFQGHFPGKPVLPGVIIIEAMAQAGILLYAAMKPRLARRHPDYFLGKVEARFKKAVSAGEAVDIEVTAEKLIDSGGIVRAAARVDGDLAAEATLAFGVRLKK